MDTPSSKEQGSLSTTQDTIPDARDKEAGEVESTSESAPQYVTGIKLALVAGSTALVCFLVLLDTTIIGTAIPRITDTFNSLHDVGWYAGAYLFGSAVPQPLTGKIYTHFKSKWTFLTFFAIFELGSILCGAAQSSDMLIVGRAIAGLGASGIINGTLTMISSCAPLEKRPPLIAITMGVNQLGIVAGPLIGGALTSYTTWRWCFYINPIVGAVVALMFLPLPVPEQIPKQKALAVLPRLHHHLDLIGFLLFAPALLQLLLALQFGGNEFAWSSSQVIGLFCGSAATFVVWLLWNRRKGEDALIPASLLKQTVFWTSGLFQAFTRSVVIAVIYYLPIYFQAILNVSPFRSGVYLLSTVVPQLFAAVASGVILKKFGLIIPLAIASTILLSTGSGLLSLLQPGSPYGYWIGFQILLGVGSGLSMQLSIIAVQKKTSAAQLATGMAFMIFMNSFGPAIVLVVCNVIFDASFASQLSAREPQLNSTAIIGAGATGFRKLVPPQDLAGVLSVYANSIDRIFYLVGAVAAACILVLWGMDWDGLRKKKTKDEKSESLDGSQ